MKKLMWSVVLLLFAGGVVAQQRKALTLEQTVTAAYEKQLISEQQKQTIDSLVVRLSHERKALAANLKAGKMVRADYSAQSKQLSADFSKRLKEVLATPETFKAWQTVRYAK